MGTMTGKTIASGPWFKSSPAVALSMCALLIAVAACSSTPSTPTPSLETSGSSPTSGATGTTQVASPVGSPEEGKTIFINKACIGCHTVEGIPEAQGKVGPDLTRQAGGSLIAGVLPRTDENMRKWLADPPAVKPGALMPNQNLTDDEIDALIAFLQTLQ